jgi:hypothetical protein
MGGLVWPQLFPLTYWREPFLATFLGAVPAAAGATGADPSSMRLVVTREPPNGLRFGFIGAWGKQPVPLIQLVNPSQSVNAFQPGKRKPAYVEINVQVVGDCQGTDSNGKPVDYPIQGILYPVSTFPMLQAACNGVPTAGTGRDWTQDLSVPSNTFVTEIELAGNAPGTFPAWGCQFGGGVASLTGDKVTSVAVTAGGCYLSTPTVELDGGLGTGAKAVANMVADPQPPPPPDPLPQGWVEPPQTYHIDSFTVSDNGDNYWWAPQVRIYGGTDASGGGSSTIGFSAS